MLPRKDQRRNVNLSQPTFDIPVLERAGAMKFTGSPHRVIHLRVLRQFLQSQIETSGPGIEAAEMTVVINVCSRNVRRVFCCTCLLMLLESLLGLLRKLAAQAICFGNPSFRAGRSIGKDQALYTVRFCQHIFLGQESSPRLTKQMQVVQPKGLPDGSNFCNKQFHLPESGIVWMVRISAA